MHRPLIGVILSYALGILIGFWLRIPFPYLFGSSLLLLLFILIFFLSRNSILSNLSIHLVLIVIGMLAHFFASNPLDPYHISRSLQEEEVKRVTLEGTIVRDPERKVGSEKERTILTIEAERIKGRGEWKKAHGLVRVSVYGEGRGDYGSRVRVRGYLSKPPLPTNPEESNYRLHLAKRGIYGLMGIRSKKDIEILGKGRINPFVNFALTIKHRMEKIVRATMDDPHSKILEGVLLGNRWMVPEEIKEVFRLTGTAHVLAISGLHVGIVATIFYLFFKALGTRRKVRAGVLIPILILFALLTGARPSTVRATIMATAILAGMIIDRDTDIFHNLALAGIFILALNPLDLFDLGFQLSFGAVISILYLAPKIEAFIFKIFIRSGLLWEYLELRANPLSLFLRWLMKLCSVTWAAQIGILPLIAHYFNLVTPIAFLANLIVVPVLGVILALGFAACIFGTITIHLAQIFNGVNWLVVAGMMKFIKFLSKLPGAYIHVPTPPIYLIIVYYLFIGGILNLDIFKVRKG